MLHCLFATSLEMELTSAVSAVMWSLPTGFMATSRSPAGPYSWCPFSALVAEGGISPKKVCACQIANLYDSFRVRV